MIFWLASSIRPARADAAATDHDALSRLIDGLQAAHSTARVIALSSGGAVYNAAKPAPYAESSEVHAANDYGKAMLGIEALLAERWPNRVVLRASNAYGPGQPAGRGQGVVADWLDSVQRGQPIQVMGDPRVKRDYVYIDDLTAVLMLAADRDDVPQLLNVGSGIPTSLAELVEAVRAAVGLRIEIEYTPPRSFDAPSTWLDVSLARSALGWRPRIDLATGVGLTWRHLGRHVATHDEG